MMRLFRKKISAVPVDPILTIPFNRVVVCLSCRSASNAYIGDACPVCSETGNLISLARWLNSDPELGQITYVYKPIAEAAHA